MEIFVHNLLTDRKPKQLQRAIAKAIKAVHGQNAVYEWRRLRNKRSFLTFPTWTMDEDFLKRYRHGFSLHGRMVKFVISNNTLNERLVESLLEKLAATQELPGDAEDEEIGRTTFEDPSVSHLAEHYDEEFVRKGIPFKSMEWGVWTTEGRIGRIGTMSRGGLVTHIS